jgi:hypothetical protein
MAKLPEEDELLTPTAEQNKYHVGLQDPYAKLSTLLPDKKLRVTSSAPTRDARIRATASQKEFDSECRRIFGQYSPIGETQLKSHYRSFINRNLSRAPEIRFALLAHLRKYDLSGTPGLKSMFNREQNQLTEIKLRAIEKAVGIKE